MRDRNDKGKAEEVSDVSPFPADQSAEETNEVAALADSKETSLTRSLAGLVAEQTAGSEFSRRWLLYIAGFLYAAIAVLFCLPFVIAGCFPYLWKMLGESARTAMVVAPYVAFTTVSVFVLIALSSLRIRSGTPLNAGANAAGALGGTGSP